MGRAEKSLMRLSGLHCAVEDTFTCFWILNSMQGNAKFPVANAKSFKAEKLQSPWQYCFLIAISENHGFLRHLKLGTQKQVTFERPGWGSCYNRTRFRRVPFVLFPMLEKTFNQGSLSALSYIPKQPLELHMQLYHICLYLCISKLLGAGTKLCF